MFFRSILLWCIFSLASLAEPAAQALADEKATLGRLIFHDTTLSIPSGQSCASCHKAENAFADNKTVSEGAIKGRFGNRNTLSLKYASFTAPFRDDGWGNWSGGFFWDGRADSLEEQAAGPFFNPLEMNTTPAKLAQALRQSSYFELLVRKYGEAVQQDDENLINAAFEALAAFQRSEFFSPFDSKFDYAQAGLIELTPAEKRGQEVFNNKGLCKDCHLSDEAQFGGRQLFASYIYHNIGVPKNPELPIYQRADGAKPDLNVFVDEGIAENPKYPEDYMPRMTGAFKTPTLRNVELTAPYMHNGVFSTLEEVVDFYNDMEQFWPPEVRNFSGLISTKLELTDQEKQDLIAFMKTLTDGFSVPQEIHRELQKQ